MFTNLKKLLKDEEAPSAVEYGLMVAAVAAVIIGTVFLLGGKTNNAFNKLAGNAQFGAP